MTRETVIICVSRKAYDAVLIGGNHLASSMSSFGCMPNEQRDYDQVLHGYGLLCADMWVAWRAIMDLRDAVVKENET
jgi:hypothetical protein